MPGKEARDGFCQRENGPEPGRTPASGKPLPNDSQPPCHLVPRAAGDHTNAAPTSAASLSTPAPELAEARNKDPGLAVEAAGLGPTGLGEAGASPSIRR